MLKAVQTPWELRSRCLINIKILEDQFEGIDSIEFEQEEQTDLIKEVK